MKKKTFSISIQNPCHQDFNQMPRKDGGVFCDSCQKVVHDFSILSDEEIVKYLSQNKSGESCGKFRNDQLNRNFILPQQKQFSFRPAKILLLSLFGLKMVNDVQAAPNYKSAIHYFEQQKYAKVPRRISGKTTDLLTGKPLSNITVSIVGHTIQATSDSTGRFKLIIPDSITDEKFTIQIGSQEYWVADTTINKTQLPFFATFRMTKVAQISSTRAKDIIVKEEYTVGKYPNGYPDDVTGGPHVITNPDKLKLTFRQRLRMKFHKKPHN